MKSYDGHACATNCTVVPLHSHDWNEITRNQIGYHKNTSSPFGAGWKLLFDAEALSGNVNPFIPQEEEKLIAELKYLLGIDVPVIASCNRVSERDDPLRLCWS